MGKFGVSSKPNPKTNKRRKGKHKKRKGPKEK